MSLFQLGKFTLASGQVSDWKVECDALTEQDWHALARISMERFNLKFSAVAGVPRGGVPFADALAPYAKEGSWLIVDDVWTTGESMEYYIKNWYSILPIESPPLKLVAFARAPIPDDVMAIWKLY